MNRLFKNRINILGRRRALVTISILLLVICSAITPIRGLWFGSEFFGGSTIVIRDANGISIEQLRSACQTTDLKSLTIQSISNVFDRQSGFVIRSTSSDFETVSIAADQLSQALDLDKSGLEVNTTSGNWRASATKSLLIAFGAALFVILVYLLIRLNFDAAICATLALFHSILLIATLYISCGFTIIPTVIYLLFAVTGYAAYTSILFLRQIIHQTQSLSTHSYITMANYVLNQLLSRTVITVLAVLLPMLAVLIFSGAAFKEFALLLIISVIVCPFSTITIAVPLLVLIKQRQPKYRKLLEKYGEGMDELTVAEQ
ncbi:MAG: hypothetical protein FWD45_07005, partial [Coriobacteriia bacterium]|nr:hypothetical protein [Coriobacteriia bacterium]